MPFSGDFLAPFIIVSPLNMVKHKNGKGPGTRDVDFDARMKLVVEMKLFRRGKSKHRTVAALAKAIASVRGHHAGTPASDQPPRLIGACADSQF